MPKYLSGRVKRTPQNRLTDDRYQYLGLDQAEPNIGDPPSASGTPNIPPGQQYQVVSVLSNPGERYWVPIGGGIIPGSLSVFDEGSLVGTLSSITQMNFVGIAITANAVSLGVAATITVTPPGNNGSVLFKDNIFDPDANSGVGTYRDDFSTSSDLVFNSTVGILTVGKGLEVGDTGLKVGVGGTFLTVAASTGLVGIATTNPTRELDVNGNIRLRKTIYDSTNDPGSQGNLLAKGTTGVEWISNNAVQTGAGGTIYDVQYHNTAGLVDGAPNFVFRSDTSRVGIGSTQPRVLLDVLGISSFRGGTFINGLTVTGVSTFVNQIKADGGIVANTARVEDLTQNRVVFAGASGELIDDSSFRYIPATDTLNILNLFCTGQAVLDELKTVGITTLMNIKVDTNTITTNSGALVLNAASGAVQSNADIFLNTTTQSVSKDTGSLTVNGGVGIEKNLNVGQNISVAGITTLASSGGITTTGGDLYVGRDLFIKRNFVIDQVDFNNLDVSGIATFRGDVEFWTNTGAAKSSYWSSTDNSLNFVSGARAKFGSNGNLQIYHNGYTNESYIQQTGVSSNFFVNANKTLFLNSTNGNSWFRGIRSGAVELYYNSSPTNRRFMTSGIGVTVIGQIDADDISLTNNLTVNGTSNFKGSVTLGDAISDNVVFNSKVNSNILPNSDSSFDLGSETLRWREIFADKFNGLGELYVDDLYVTGIATFKNDVEFWGNAGTAKSVYWDKSADALKFNNNSSATFGSNEELKIYQSSDDSFIQSTDASNNLYVETDLGFYIRGNTSSPQTLLAAKKDQGVDLYYLSTKRIETTVDGVKISGGLQDKDGDLGAPGQVLASTGSELDWVEMAPGTVTAIDVKQENYCGVDDTPLNPITVTPTSAGISTVSIAETSNAYGRKYVQDNDPTTVSGGSYVVCDGDIWYDTDGTNTSGFMPSGSIIMYNGDTAPSGWVLCDNSAAAQAAGAPDLRDRFIVASGNTYNRGDTGSGFGGGSDFVLLSEQTATGTSVEFTGIPSSAQEITVMMKGVSASGGNHYVVQLGTSSGYITSGYVGNSENSQGTTAIASNTTDKPGFVIFGSGGSSEFHGSMIINKASSNSYTEIGEFRKANTGGCVTRGSLSSVSGTVDRLKVKFNGTNTFDAGTMSLSYKTSGAGSGTVNTSPPYYALTFIMKL